MRTETIIQVLMPFIQAKMEKLLTELSETWDTNEFEAGVREIMDVVEACLVQIALNAHLADEHKLNSVKELGGKLGMKFKEYRKLRVRLQSGQQMEVNSPYFIKAGRKRRPKNGVQMDEGGIWAYLVWGLRGKQRQTA